MLFMAHSNSIVDKSIDQLLYEAVVEAQKHPPKSMLRKQALTRVIALIEQSNQLSRLVRYSRYYSASKFTDLYNEAKQKTYLYICEKIHLYRPEHPVIAWVNNTLNYMFREILKKQHISLSSADLENYAERDKDIDHESLYEFLECDPEGHCAAYFIRNHPDITFQYLAIAHYINGNSWTCISLQTGIPIQTLSSFFKRTLKKLLPYFEDYIKA